MQSVLIWFGHQIGQYIIELIKFGQQLLREVELPDPALEVLCWAFLTVVSMLYAYFRSWKIVDPRALKVSTVVSDCEAPETGRAFTQLQGRCMKVSGNWSMQTLRQEGYPVWTWCFLGLLSPEKLPHVFFTGSGDCRGCWLCDVVREGKGCISGFAKPAVKNSGSQPVKGFLQCGGDGLLYLVMSCRPLYTDVRSLTENRTGR